jgi:phosphoribosylformimino-5-aminoimidazole carboxamide ribotide isomerase
VQVIPSIDLLGGSVVRLRQGDYSEVTDYGADALGVLRGFVRAGARRVHVVDLDAARGTGHNRDLVTALAATPDVELQVGGGIRDRGSVEGWFDRGVTYVVLGTLAAEDPEEAVAIARRWPGRVLAGLDARGDRIATRGWEVDAGLSLDQAVERLAGAPFAGLVYTQVARDGMLAGPDLDGIRRLCAGTPLPVVASGGLSSIEDLRQAAAAGANAGIVGRALYEGHLDLGEAIAELR